jgi:hypothetical protein
VGSKIPPDIDLATSNGAPVLVSDVASVGQVVYVAVSRAGQWDEVTVEAWHNDSASHTLTLEVIATDGTTVLAELTKAYTATDNHRVHVSNWRLRNGVSLAVYADTTDVFYVKVEADQLQSAVRQ